MMLLLALMLASGAAANGPLAWPSQAAETRPWSYWWWLGSAVDPANLTRELERYRDAGMGGVHVIPIYGAKGYGSRWQSIVLRTFERKSAIAPAWTWWTTRSGAVPLEGAWRVTLLQGGPELPPPFTTSRLPSWTELGGINFANLDYKPFDASGWPVFDSGLPRTGHAARSDPVPAPESPNKLPVDIQQN